MVTNHIEMYSTHNEGKHVVSARFTRTRRTEQNLQIHDFSMKKRVY